jgi:hypothetical protein
MYLHLCIYIFMYLHIYVSTYLCIYGTYASISAAIAATLFLKRLRAHKYNATAISQSKYQMNAVVQWSLDISHGAEPNQP